MAEEYRLPNGKVVEEGDPGAPESIWARNLYRIGEPEEREDG